MSWYLHPNIIKDPNGWTGFATKDYIHASESPFDLHLTPEEITFLPEEVQSSEKEWTKYSEPNSLWTEEAEPDPDFSWYLEKEPPIFYPELTSLVSFYNIFEPYIAPFYGWQVSGYLGAFYPTISVLRPMVWELFYAPIGRFYIGTESASPAFYWVIIDDMV